MGIYDRDYYRNPGGGNAQLKSWASTAVGTILLLNIGCWFLQLMTKADSTVLHAMCSTGNSIFGGGFPELWRLLTACFVHAQDGIFHIGFNMLGLWFFGREIERMYGKKEFWIFYLFSGAIAVTVESYVQYQQGAFAAQIPIVGASGGVSAVVVLCTLFFPRRPVFFGIPLWAVCGFFLLKDLFGAVGSSAGGIAHMAHLAGAGWALIFKLYDLRWSRLSPWKSKGRRNSPGQKGSKSRWGAKKQESEKPRVPDAGSRRVDELLEKISRDGMGSLSDEEREFLVENSRRYRRS